LEQNVISEGISYALRDNLGPQAIFYAKKLGEASTLQTVLKTRAAPHGEEFQRDHRTFQYRVLIFLIGFTFREDTVDFDSREIPVQLDRRKRTSILLLLPLSIRENTYSITERLALILQ
jgi:hypothetical protein